MSEWPKFFSFFHFSLIGKADNSGLLLPAFASRAFSCLLSPLVIYNFLLIFLKIGSGLTSVPILWLGRNQHQFLSFCLCMCVSVSVKCSNSGFSIVFSTIYLCQSYKVKARLDLKQSILSIRLHRKMVLARNPKYYYQSNSANSAEDSR